MTRADRSSTPRTRLTGTPSTKDQTMTTTTRHSCTISTTTRLARFAPAYDRETATHRVLCALPTLSDAVAYLENLPRPQAPHRPSVLRAWVTLAQTTGHVVWTELLLLAYRPLLRSFVATGETDPEEREAEVVARFFEAVAQANVRAASISEELRERTQRLLDAAALAEVDWRKVLLVPDMAVYAAPDAAGVDDLIPSDRARAREEISDRDLLHTLGEQGALTDLVEALYAHAPAGERRTVYARLARRRARLARALRGGKARRPR